VCAAAAVAAAAAAVAAALYPNVKPAVAHYI